MSAYRRNINTISTVVALSAVSLIANNAFADDTPGTPPVFMMSWDASNDNLDQSTYDPFQFGTREWGTWNLGGTVDNNPDSPTYGQVMDGSPRTRTGWRYTGGNSHTAWSLAWDCVVNEDPFVDATINVTNNSMSDQTFWIYMPLNIAPSILGGTFMSSYVSAVVSDNDFNFAMFQTNGTDPVFQGYIDGVPQGASASLWHPGYTLTAGTFGANNDDASLLNQAGPNAISQIALRLVFTLSPGDSASVTGTFEVQPIPGPGALAAFALFGGLVSRRRRA